MFAPTHIDSETGKAVRIVRAGRYVEKHHADGSMSVQSIVSFRSARYLPLSTPGAHLIPKGGIHEIHA